MIIAGQLIAAKRDPADDIAIDAMNDVLGGAFTSRINMNLREDKHWSYGADTIVVDAQAQRPFIAIAPVQTDKTAESMQEIKREIDRVRRRARGHRRRGRDEQAAQHADACPAAGRPRKPSRATSRSSCASICPTTTGMTTPSSSAASTSRKSRDAAARTLLPGQLTWVVVGDLDVIEAEVRALELGEIRIVDVDGNPAGAPMNVR